MLVGIAFSSRALKSVGKEINQIANIDIPLYESINLIASYQLKQSLNFEKILRYSSQITNNREEDWIPAKEAIGEFYNYSKLIREKLSHMKFILSHTSNSLNRIYEEITETTKVFELYEERALVVVKLFEERKILEAKKLLFTEPLEIEESTLRNRVETILQLLENNTNSTSQNAQSVQRKAIEQVIFISILALIIGLLLSFLITRGITKPLGEAVKVADQIASGNKEIIVNDYKSGEVSTLLTAMKKMSDAVQSSEQALKERAHELARSNAELEQFAYVASHDLQEPLRMVASYVQLLAKRYQGKLDDDADEFIKYAVDGVVRMKNLINDLLEYSRVGRREITKVPLDCSDILTKTLQNLKEAIADKSASISYDKLPTIMGDETQMIQLFQNLIGNGIKFCKDKTPSVHISAQKEGGYWNFSFRDNGIGIEDSSTDRIFQIFQRLHTRREYPGTGIGLAICKRIVERHGGTIFVESKQGVGSTFKFNIPIT